MPLKLTEPYQLHVRSEHQRISIRIFVSLAFDTFGQGRGSGSSFFLVESVFRKRSDP